MWKLHNAVSASIERPEDWYKSAESITTSRYWPNLHATLHRGRVRSGLVSAEHVAKLVDVVEVANELARYRTKILGIQRVRSNGTSVTKEELPARCEGVMKSVRPLLEKLDQRMVESGLMQEVYRFVPGLIDPLPEVLSEMEAAELVRNRNFTLN